MKSKIEQYLAHTVQLMHAVLIFHRRITNIQTIF